MPIPPLDVMIEAGVGFVLALFGQLVATGPLRNILASKGMMIAHYRTRHVDHYQNRATALFDSKSKNL